MAEQKRGEDAGDRAPKGPADGTSRSGEKRPGDRSGGERQDGPNYDEATEGGRAIANDDLSSANDE